jgi:serine/threonine protein kinase
MAENKPNERDFCAAEYLEGVELPNGWKVLHRLSNSTGGNFGVSYEVERKQGGKIQRAFLKALNLRRIAKEDNFARALERHLQAFNFERDTLHLCRNHRMRRIATLLDAGEHRLPNNILPVCYIVFELADAGDVRKYLATYKKFDLAWTLRTLHQIAVGLQQLHTHGIAHQDVKPSNVLIFRAFGAKVSDLGCADVQERPSQSPRGTERFAGDPSYAPPELLYNEISLDWKVRRFGCDLYLLGSMTVFFFTGGVSMTGLLKSKIDSQHAAANWPHDYRLVLPYVRAAFEEALETIQTEISESVRSEIIELLRILCDPDPKRRGYVYLGARQYNLERCISRLDWLASKAEYDVLSIKNGRK